MRLSVYHLGGGVVLLRDGAVADDGEATDIRLELEPGQGYGGYTHEELVALHRKRIEVPKPAEPPE